MYQVFNGDCVESDEQCVVSVWAYVAELFVVGRHVREQSIPGTISIKKHLTLPP